MSETRAETWTRLRLKGYEDYTAERYMVSSSGRLATFNRYGRYVSRRKARPMIAQFIRGLPHYSITLPCGRFTISSEALKSGEYLVEPGKWLDGVAAGAGGPR